VKEKVNSFANDASETAEEIKTKTEEIKTKTEDIVKPADENAD
jgi:methyl-accepting chemotaxis protein